MNLMFTVSLLEKCIIIQLGIILDITAAHITAQQKPKNYKNNLKQYKISQYVMAFK